ncbi:MAG TPA: hypothetical protein ENK16_02995 [Chromatiales bacterium]|nr:hypothetical protein [Chromatiales bacterium]
MKTLILVLGLLPAVTASAAAWQRIETDHTLNYLLHLPADYDTSQQTWPVLIFLHGIGEKGSGSAKAIEKVARHGPFRSLREGHWDESLSLIVVGPQFGGLRFHWPVDKVIEVLDHLEANYRIDPARVYLTGVSVGGRGVWDVVSKYPRRFAAIVPVGAWAKSLEKTCASLQNLGVWAFHGERDGLIGLKSGRRPVDILNSCDPPPRVPAHLTVLKDVGHGNWEIVYDNRHGDHHAGADGREYGNIYRWMLSHRLTDRQEQQHE